MARFHPGRTVVTLEVKFEPRDIWVGLYWEYARLEAIHTVGRRFFLCLIPLFPIILTLQRTFNEKEMREFMESRQPQEKKSPNE